MTTHTEKSPLTAPTVNEDNKSIPERSNLTVPFQPPHRRHKAYKQENGVYFSYCGHTRSVAEAKRIIADLGEAWNHCLPCSPCYAMAEAEREYRHEQAKYQKAVRLVRLLMDYEEDRDK
ncbi:hypothetical protein CGLAR1_12565 [Corynebacterium glutamicum]|uniref:hypothetical protein n=1 Tax=Corynebacterium glutamicum TaxID=1718 RepID=UPI0004F89732|nr:hypothetical protein [Corynebacterium glutamicum]AIK86035.1 hypothetical protein CGLAR1_12565 [Corynebacterium glutamicum]AIK88818.1 hypothetical protein AR0_12700 [Corynebacterium glutamicum]